MQKWKNCHRFLKIDGGDNGNRPYCTDWKQNKMSIFQIDKIVNCEHLIKSYMTTNLLLSFEKKNNVTHTAKANFECLMEHLWFNIFHVLHQDVRYTKVFLNKNF